MTRKAAGDKVKTDKRLCRRLARLHRAGELAARRFEEAAPLQATFEHDRAVVVSRATQLGAVEADLGPVARARAVRHCGAAPGRLPGVTRLAALILQAEVWSGVASLGPLRSWASSGWCRRSTQAGQAPSEAT